MNYARTRVLIANPDVDALSRIRCLFSSRGYDVKTAIRASDALTILRRQHPQLLVVDENLRWGGCDGLLAVLSEEEDTCHIRVIVTRDGRPLHEAPLLPSAARCRTAPKLVLAAAATQWSSANEYDVFA